MAKPLGILGSTGSIGTQALSIIKNNRDSYPVKYLTAGRKWELLLEQAIEFDVPAIGIENLLAAEKLKKELPDNIQLYVGSEGISELVKKAETEFVLSAIVGFAGVKPTYNALLANNQVALANKESLVSAGKLITDKAQSIGKPLIAVDSEHSAILQCLSGENVDDIEKLILTASGGPFRKKSKPELENVTVSQALKHPNWSMGSKITIDSATLMNKGLEVIEAKWLFDIPVEQIEVVVHPQSIIHSMVQFKDGSVKAQLGVPDMAVPIAYALAYPNRLSLEQDRMDITKIAKLDFELPDKERFPCLQLAFDSLKEGGSYPTAMNAANEIAVERFLKQEIRFTEIPKLIDFVLQENNWSELGDLEDIIEKDKNARNIAYSYKVD
ncbi:MAG: 1-deoxy-D-xylulose-5-phosphate reductoisomerase [Candidatus Kapaibacteriales bacterium]